MISRKELKKEQKDCAKMLGMTLSEYKKYCKRTKIYPTGQSKSITDNSFLKMLGIDQSKLKLRKEI